MNLAGHVIKSSKDFNIYQPSSHSDEYFYMPVYSFHYVQEMRKVHNNNLTVIFLCFKQTPNNKYVVVTPTTKI